MRFQSKPEVPEIFLALKEKGMSVGKRNFIEANFSAWTQLRRDCQISRDHVSDLRIAANRLAIIQKQNRFAAWRNLDRARRYRFGKKIDILCALQPGSFKANAHSIGIWRDAKWLTR